jgi:hypothetical protein
MNREYELFERFPDDSMVWRGSAVGLGNVRIALQEIAKSTTNECVAVHLHTQEIVDRLNANRGNRALGKPVVFQIAYAESAAITRSLFLRDLGYEVSIGLGNEAAKEILRNLRLQCDLFIVGHTASQETRSEMAAWLKANYPEVPILALNPPEEPVLADADYNVWLDGQDAWLSKIARVVARNGKPKGTHPQH